MATTFFITAVLEDDYGRQARKVFQSQVYNGVDVGADRNSVATDWAAFQADLLAITEAQLLTVQIADQAVVSDTPTVGANIDEGATLSVRKANNKKAVIKVPAPVNSIFNADGTVDLTDAIVTNYYGHFEAAGFLTVSDGELAAALLSGKLDK